MSVDRDAAARCDLCLRGVDDPATLAEYAGAQVCDACRGGGAKDAARRWRIELAVELKERRSPSGHVVECRAEARRPTRLELDAQLRPEKLLARLFGSSHDAQTGTPAFDKRVSIEEPGIGVTMDVLSDGRVQAAVLECLRVASTVELSFSAVLVRRTENATFGFAGATLDAIELATAALAIAIERWAQRRP